MKTICELLEENRAKWSGKPYIFTKRGEGFEPKSFAEVAEETERFAASLIAAGLSDKNIMLYAQNSYEWIIIALAVTGYVGTLMPVDKEWTAFDIENAMSAIETDAVFYERSKSDVISAIRKKFPAVSWFCIEDCFEELVSSQLSCPAGIRDLNRRAMIFFSSGTTNKPKAIPLTQANLLNNWEATYARTPIDEADSVYIFLPFSHVYGWISNLLHSLTSGARAYLCSDITRIAEELMEVRPTVFCTVPLVLCKLRYAMNEQILQMLKEIRFLYCGGSFLDPAIKKYFIESGVNLMEAYGTTETSSIISLSLPNDEKLDSVGVIMDGLDVRIIDPDENGVGEIIVGGGSVSSGYIYRNDRYSDFDDDGYYHTGDLGMLDETRHLFLKGRKKRVIITANGRNVYPDELEELIAAGPDIQSAVVFEEEHHISAKVISGASAEEVEAAVREINEKLPRYKQIRSVYINTPGGRIK